MGKRHIWKLNSLLYRGTHKYDKVGKGKDGVVCGIDFHVERGALKEIP